MTEITSEEKTKLFEKLPEELRDFMESENTGAFLLYLGGKYKLSDDKVSLLSKLVGDVILGITPITSLAQEISLKITTDSQVAMSLAQELYADLLSPVISKTPITPQANVGTPAPQMPAMPSKQTPKIVIPPTMSPVSPIQAPSSKFQVPSVDRYREPANGAPGIVDLRKMPPAVSRVEPLSPPVVSKVEPPPSPRPLTFTKPVEPIKPTLPLIEAEPHLPAKVSPEISSETLESKPQYIIRPPGSAPTDLPRNILDLKKDKGEF